MLAIILIADGVLAMVLIEDALTLLMLIEQLECKPTTAMAMSTMKQQLNTVLGVAVKQGPPIATIMGMVDVLPAGKQHDQHVRCLRQ